MAHPSGEARALDLGTASALSVAAHATAAFVLLGIIHLAQLHLFDRDAEPTLPPVSQPIETMVPEIVLIELPRIPEKSPLIASEKASHPAVEVTPGGSTVPRLDQDRKGRGGDDEVRERALNLADQDDGITRMPSTMSSLTVSQLQRIDSHKRRRSYEDYRASREPMELTFVNMGTTGVAHERRPQANFDPRLGLRFAQERNDVGGVLGAARLELGEGERSRKVGTDVLGGRVRSPGQGALAMAMKGAESPAVDNAHARPLVMQGDPSVAATKNGRPNDDSENPEAVEPAMQSLLHASTSGARHTGDGRGGDPGPGANGSGGTKGAGQTASPAGAGGTGPGDVEVIGYKRAMMSKVHPLWAHAFPRSAALEGKGGTAVIAFVVEADGSVSGARVARSSGIPEFDENVRQAVLRGAPFGKLPAALGSRFATSITFNAPNPAVRPKFSNDGVH